MNQLSTPIQVGLIGLGVSENSWAPGAWAYTSHLPAFLYSPHYVITALCNSSVKSAEASIHKHKLGADVKAYGNPSDIAADPNVDIVVIVVNVSQQYALALPALKAGKAVYVEWPLVVTTAEAVELASLAKSKNVRTVVGLQARVDPLFLELGKILRSEKIGKIVSTTATGSFPWTPLDAWPEAAQYTANSESGGNNLSIFFGHFIDIFTHILGNFRELTSVLKTQYPNITVVSETGIKSADRIKTAADQILVQGELDSGAVASVNFRSGPQTIDGNCLRWLITGTGGEIEVIVPGYSAQLGTPGATISIHVKNGTREIVPLAINDPEHVAKVQFPATNIARLHETFATDKSAVEGHGGKEYADFEDALATHQLLDRITKADEKRVRGV